MRTAIRILFLLLLCCTQNLSGQILPFHHYSIQDGLVSDDVNSICQDSSGIIWIAADEGLSRYDSRDFTSYTMEDGLPTNNLDFVLADRFDGNRIWIGTVGQGVLRYERGKFRQYGAALPPDQRIITSLCMDHAGNLWCANESFMFGIRADSIFHIKNPLGIKSVVSICEDSSGGIQIAASNGLYRYSPSDGKFAREPLFLSVDETLTAVMCAGDGGILALTRKGTLVEFKDGTLRKITLSRIGVFSGMFRAAAPGYVWITSDHGIFKLNTEDLRDVQHITLSNGLPGNNVQTALVDHEGVLWLGTDGKGMAKLAHPNLLLFKIPQSRKDVYNISVVLDGHDHIWAATSDRLIEIWNDREGQWHRFTHVTLSPHSEKAFGKICISRSDELAATFVHGLVSRFRIVNKDPGSSRPSHLVVVSSANLSRHHKFYSLYVCMIDDAGRLWVSAIDLGVAVYSNSVPMRLLKIFTSRDGLPGKSIRRIFQDRSGNYWFGGYNTGLVRIARSNVEAELDGRTDSVSRGVTKFTTEEGLPGNDVRAITEDKDGNLYVGTRYRGLAVYGRRAFSTVTRKEGLYSNGIWDIACTDEGTWLATQSGVERLNPGGGISGELAGEIPMIPFYSIASRGGELVFANPTELLVYFPKKSHLKRIPVPVYITGINVNGNEAGVESGLELSDVQNNITISFIGVTNVGGGERTYEYRLLNEDESWTRISGRNSVTFASLQPGTYTFQVVAEASGGLKSVRPAAITFKIDSPFYSEWWFEGGVALIVILSVAAAVRFRERRRFEIERVRTRIATELHDEIGSGLTKIAILSEHALFEHRESEPDHRTDASRGSASIERVGSIARRLVDQMADVIWSIDPKYDEVEDFLVHFKNYAYEVCEAKGIELRIVTENIRDVKLDSQAKRKLHLISVEALNNSLKHSGCSVIEYDLAVRSNSIVVVFADNGTGLKGEAFGKGNGLVNMKRHAEELRGKITFNSGPQGGTVIMVEFPVRKRNYSFE